MKISATIITFNEEKHIRECISSLLPVADEVIVVDSFSKDNTAEICKSFKEVTFLEHVFEGHVEQKNFAIDQASNKYVLSLDADERLSQDLQQEIIILKTKNNPADAYSMPRLNNHYGKWIRHGGHYPDRKIRLWDRSKGKWGSENPHDKVITTSDNIQLLKGDLLHYTTASIFTHLNQVNKFSEIAADALMKSDKKVNAYLKVLFDPPFMFLKKYVFQLGFLDGFEGFVIAIISAHSKFLKYAKYIQKKRSNNQ